jgi:hypothetical protein
MKLCQYAECHCAECRNLFYWYDECRYAECRGAIQNSTNKVIRTLPQT